MSASEYELLRKQLEHGERLLWSGRPRRGFHVSNRARSGCFGGLFFVLVTTIFGVFAYRGGQPGVLVFAVIVMLFLGIPIVSNMFIDRWRRGTRLYGLTNRRAIVIGGILRRRVRSVRLYAMKEIVLKVHANGRGTITCVSMNDAWYRKNKKGEFKQVPLFRSIVDVRHVHDLLLEAKGDPISPRH